ncbi:MAG TPA: hypothetical protein VK155_14335 [Bacteroidales bacterium]|nr:hypothetical protein [Bacteroidales bacterium]
MKKTLTMVAFCATVICCCTPVKFYSDQEMTKPTGLKLYTAKPFLLSESEPETGRIVKSTVIYLPDLANPQYLAVKNALGASNTDIKMNDGILTSFGFEFEQMMPETIESVAALLSKTAGAVGDINGLKGSEGIKAGSYSVRLYEIVIEPSKTWLREISFNKE